MKRGGRRAGRTSGRLVVNLSAMGGRPVAEPSFSALCDELNLIRRRGIAELRFLDLPAWQRACRAAGDVDDDAPVDAPQVEALLRRGVDGLGGGRMGECAELLFGLSPGTRGDSPTQLRRDAAERWGVSEARFRRDPQTKICNQIVDAVLLYLTQQQERRAHIDLERRAAPSTRLAISWLERFEAYYRMWTPISGLAGDLCAYRLTLLEEDRPYDEPPGANGPDDPGYTQEMQAEGYLRAALWHYIDYLVAIQRYINRYGGLWLLSDAKAEEELAESVSLIQWSSPFDESRDSLLRAVHDYANSELDQFRVIAENEPDVGDRVTEWNEWAGQCRCIWQENAEVAREHFPTHRHHAGIDRRCPIHSIIAACNDYTTLVDDDWRRIADWYRLSPLPWLPA